MAVYNYAGGEVNIKIVYYGPGLSGKTTNLEHMYSKLPRENKGKMVSMKTRTDRTLFFDFLPIEVDGLNGMTVRFLLYTVPGQVYYNATRKLVLKGVDAIVFVADSDPERMDDNRESLENLEDNLNELGLSLSEVPWVMQYNKRDLPLRVDREVLDRELNGWNASVYEAVAATGQGVYETFEGIGRKVFRALKNNMKNPAANRQDAEKREPEEEISVEVVAQGKQRVYNSETDKSDSLGYAEEREEEHESVSEFVENVLREGEIKDSINMGSTREGYEEYGHMVELGNGAGRAAGGGAAKGPVAGKPDGMDIINDPLDKLCEYSPAGVLEETNTAGDSQSVAAGGGGTGGISEKILTVALELSEEEIRNHLPVRVILDIKVTAS